VPEAFDLQTLRTARTKASPRGGFDRASPVALLVGLQRELVRRTDMDPGQVEDVIIGCASQNAEQGANIARTATMLAGWGDVHGVSINRFCASGIGAVATAAARFRVFERRGGRHGVAAVSGTASLGVAVLVERVVS
jgi:acetyl-CoA C-acetyltransferase